MLTLKFHALEPRIFSAIIDLVFVVYENFSSFMQYFTEYLSGNIILEVRRTRSGRAVRAPAAPKQTAKRTRKKMVLVEVEVSDEDEDTRAQESSETSVVEADASLEEAQEAKEENCAVSDNLDGLEDEVQEGTNGVKEDVVEEARKEIKAEEIEERQDEIVQKQDEEVKVKEEVEETREEMSFGVTKVSDCLVKTFLSVIVVYTKIYNVFDTSPICVIDFAIIN